MEITINIQELDYILQGLSLLKLKFREEGNKYSSTFVEDTEIYLNNYKDKL